MAVAVLVVEVFFESGAGEGEVSMGVAMDAGKIRSSRFMASG